MYEMKDEYLTGIEFIDNEHRRLFEIANEVYELSINEFIADKYDNIREVLRELREYTKIHFTHEEEYMKSINYKKMFSQIIEHKEFVEKLDELDIDSLDENSDEMISEILEFLTNWLVNHILYSDKQIGK